MMSRKLRVTTALLAVTLLFTALASAAGAATNRVQVGSRVTLAQTDPFHGEVLSQRAACERGRTVAVYLAKPGPDGLYDTTKSDTGGRWEIPATPTGKFYAVAGKRSIDTGNKILVCEAATSAKVAF